MTFFGLIIARNRFHFTNHHRFIIRLKYIELKTYFLHLLYVVDVRFQTTLMAGSCCLSLLVPATQVWMPLGTCCHRGRGLRGRGLTIGPSGRLPSTSRSYCCVWKKRTRDWRVSCCHDCTISMKILPMATWMTNMKNMSIVLLLLDLSLSFDI